MVEFKKLMQTNKIRLTALILAIASTAATGQDAKEILRRMENNIRGDASYTEMTMETVRPRYTREISMRSWTLGERPMPSVMEMIPEDKEGHRTIVTNNEATTNPGLEKFIAKKRRFSNNLPLSSE